MPSFEKPRQLVKAICRKCELPPQVPGMPSTFHPLHNETLSVIACASAIQIVRPSESIAETQPQLQPAFAEIVRDNLHSPRSDCVSLLYTLMTKLPYPVITDVDVVTLARWDMFNAQSESLCKSTQFSSLPSLHFLRQESARRSLEARWKTLLKQLP